MAHEGDVVVTKKSTKENDLDPSQFDATMRKLLIGQGAERYVNIFKQHNIGQSTLAILSDADLIKLGIDDAGIRNNIINMTKDLPIFEEVSSKKTTITNRLSPKEITDILVESSDHLNRIYLSMLANTVALKQTKDIQDSLLYRDKFASDVALTTLSEITNILNSMEITLHTKMKVHSKESKKNKKIVVASVGSAIIIALGVLFVKSLKELR